MNDKDPIINTGLRGITVASTRISDVNGAEGKLIYRGYLVKDLAEMATFEEVTHLLLHEKLPGETELVKLKREYAAERELPPTILDTLKATPKDALPMDVLQSCVAMLANYDPDLKDETRDAVLRQAIRLIARIPLIIAAWARIRAGQEYVPPSPEIDHAANFLYMLNGKKPDDELTSFFDTALVLHAEHSFNASTFSARQVASTQAHIYASIAAAVGSLSGALHGGANTRVMNMLLEIGSVDKIDSYIDTLLESGGKIMGLGHAVYQVDDPRAIILAPMSEKLGERTGDTRWYDLSRDLEIKGKAAFLERKGREIFANVDFYSASLYYYMGIPTDLFTPVFAAARAAGWVAHVLEEKFAEAAPKATLYRPESEYIGDYCGPDECTFLPMDEREDDE